MKTGRFAVIFAVGSLLALLVPYQTAPQVVQPCCSADDCIHRHVSPNLELAKPTHLFGTLRDPSGAPFEKTNVQLRNWI
jgi:hypothetical protein